MTRPYPTLARLLAFLAKDPLPLDTELMSAPTPPESIKALTRGRQVFTAPTASVYPLRDSEGRTWAERRRLKDAGLL